jgi:hypothetical protein
VASVLDETAEVNAAGGPEAEVVASVAEEDMDVSESTVLFDIEDPVVIGEPIASVVGAGGVVISAAGTVTFLKATPLLVYTHKHMGVCKGT